MQVYIIFNEYASFLQCTQDREIEGFKENRATSCHSLQISQLQEEVIVLRAENAALQEQLGRQESELNRTRAALASCREERDRCQRRVSCHFLPDIINTSYCKI